MSKRSAVLLTAIAIAAALIWWFGRQRVAAPAPASNPRDGSHVPSAEPPASASSVAPVLPSPPTLAPPPDLQAPRSTPLPPSDRRDLQNPLAPASIPQDHAPRPAEADPTAAADLDKIAMMLRDYRTIAGENPVGTNAEIMKAMMGENPRGAKIGPPEGMSLNAGGELLDSWGSPIFFHQLSRDWMEIHSAGPDRRLGTEDDLILK